MGDPLTADPRYWEMDSADRQEQFQRYANVTQEDVTVERAYELGLVGLTELDRHAEWIEQLTKVVAQLATERTVRPSAPPARRRGRPTRALRVRASPERGYMTVLGKRVTYEQAQQLGSLIFQALNGTEGAPR